MENRRCRNSSGDKFSFPTFPVQDKEFEFDHSGCATPGSPNSPADHLFFNGRLLPHAFPLQHNITPYGTFSRSTSRTSSISSSRNSLMSSRSNSTSSLSSSCSSARTSTSDQASERKLVPLNEGKVALKTTFTRERYEADKPVLINPQYGWQFVAPVPVLTHQVSRRKKAEARVQQESKAKKRADGKTGAKAGLCRRFFRSFVSTCKECHAMEPAKIDRVLQGKIELQ
ncbi:hypothetical protein RJ639_033372 [Escallonia herrerae]|uniref:Uncharacterized protein n=1 Tax=Escallonia herrerae TaxID=1293975 RepID=A0AA89B9G6_9ASTE|nr:hypothetical protein RJ639_033372 [Escallonia herrerae]